MALGVELLMQSMGFDPNDVKAKFEDAKQLLDKAFKHFDEKLDRIERKQDEVLAEMRGERNERLGNGTGKAQR